MSGSPTPSDLWSQAGGGTPEFSAERYDQLLREHGLWVNFDLIQRLATKPHKHLNISDCAKYTCEHGHDHIGTGEVLEEARTVQHLLDLAGVPEGEGYSAHIDARVYLLVAKVLALRERLDRIVGWHARESGPAGTVGDYCTECGTRWPCDTRRMAEGTYVDPEATDG